MIKVTQCRTFRHKNHLIKSWLPVAFPYSDVKFPYNHNFNQYCLSTGVQYSREAHNGSLWQSYHRLPRRF